jgi:hypothetical protein
MNNFFVHRDTLSLVCFVAPEGRVPSALCFCRRVEAFLGTTASCREVEAAGLLLVDVFMEGTEWEDEEDENGYEVRNE